MQASYLSDKYLPLRAIKGSPTAPGQTKGKNFLELFNQKRLQVRQGDWQVHLVLVCMNLDRWSKFQACRDNFDRSGVDATEDFKDFNWSVAGGEDGGTFPVINAKRGECWLWSGQSLDILHGVMARGFQRIHCESNATTGYGAMGRGNYFTDKFSKALLYAMNLRNEYFGAAKGSDIRVLMLSRVLLGNYYDLDTATKEEKTAQRFAHNLELTGSAQYERRKRIEYVDSVTLYRDKKLQRAAKKKGFKALRALC
jgi:Poly(ADP-ribose) polymerase catalytic domain